MNEEKSFLRFLSPRRARRLTSILLLLLLLASQQGSLPLRGSAAPARAPEAQLIPAAIITVGGLLLLGNNLADRMEQLISQAEGAVQRTLQDAHDRIRALVKDINDKFQNDLNVAIDSIRGAAHDLLVELEDQMLQINQYLADRIEQLTKDAISVIDTASARIQELILQLEQSLKDVVVVLIGGVAILINQVFVNIVLIIALIALALVGLLLISSLFRRKWPSGGQGILLTVITVVFVVGFGSLLLPVTRVWLVNLGVGQGVVQQQLENYNKPYIAFLRPTSVDVGHTQALEIWGLMFPISPAPSIRIGDLSAKVLSYTVNTVTVDVTQLKAGHTTQAPVVMSYGTSPGEPLQTSVQLVVPTPTAAPTAPGAPSNVTAFAQGQNTILITWKKNSADEDGFHIFRDDAPFRDAPAGTTSFTDTSVTCGRTYKYSVESFKSDPQLVSPQSNTASASTDACATPTPREATLQDFNIGFLTNVDDKETDFNDVHIAVLQRDRIKCAETDIRDTYFPLDRNRILSFPVTILTTCKKQEFDNGRLTMDVGAHNGKKWGFLYGFSLTFSDGSTYSIVPRDHPQPQTGIYVHFCTSCIDSGPWSHQECFSVDVAKGTLDIPQCPK